MSSPILSGNAGLQRTTIPNGLKFTDSFNDHEKLAAVAWTTVREIFPVQNTESDYSVKVRIELMAEIIAQVGPDRFMKAVKDAIAMSQRRYDVTVHRIRICAGLPSTEPRSAVATAWEFVTKVLIDYVRQRPDGSVHMETCYKKVNGDVEITNPPAIPPAVDRAIQSLGGWASLFDSWPSYWPARYREFRELYHDQE